MRKLIGTCLLCCLWSVPASACFDEYVPVSKEPQPQNNAQPEETSPSPLPGLAARLPAASRRNHAMQSSWLAAGFGTTAVATLFAGIIFASMRGRRRAVPSVTTDSVTPQSIPHEQS